MGMLGWAKEAVQVAKHACAVDPREPSHAQLARELREQYRRELERYVAAAKQEQQQEQRKGGEGAASEEGEESVVEQRKASSKPAAAPKAPAEAAAGAGAAAKDAVGGTGVGAAQGAAEPPPVVWRLNQITVEEVSGSDSDEEDEGGETTQGLEAGTIGTTPHQALPQEEDQQVQAVGQRPPVPAATPQPSTPPSTPKPTPTTSAGGPQLPPPPRSAFDLQRAFQLLAPRGGGCGGGAGAAASAAAADGAPPCDLVSYVRSIPPRRYKAILKDGLTLELLGPLTAALAALAGQQTAEGEGGSSTGGGAQAEESAAVFVRDALNELAGVERFGLVSAMARGSSGGGIASAVRRSVQAIEAAGVEVGRVREQYKVLLK